MGVLFAAAVGLFMFSNGRFSVIVCAWLAPVVLLRFTRTGNGPLRLILAYAGLSFAYWFQFYSMAPFEGVGYAIFSAAVGITLIVPYIVDRYVGLRWSGLARTFAFPLTLVACEFFTAFGPLGSWCSIAYSQYESLTLVQLVSVTGLYGLTFLIGWFAAVTNGLWEAGFDISRARSACGAFGVVFLAVLLYGGLRLAAFPPAAPTIRVAAITRPDEQSIPDAPSPQLNRRLMLGGPASADEFARVRRRSERVADVMLGRADVEAKAGARIVTFGEFKPAGVAAGRTCADRPRRRTRAARRRVPSVAARRVRDRPPSVVDDPFVLVGPSGAVVWQYRKTELPPGEGGLVEPSNGVLPVAQTPYGRLGGAVAFDMDFPSFLSQAGRNRTDMLIVPENEAAAFDPMHSRMALYRAVENGFNLLLQASQSLSLVCDYQGRVYALMDHYHAGDRVIVGQLSTKGVATVYALGGWVFPQLCLVALSALLIATIVARRRIEPAARAYI